jgi:hypothetical protein
LKQINIDSCVATSAGDPAEARSRCTCVMDQLEQQLTYAEAIELNQEILENPTDLPAELVAASAACQ